MPRGACWPEGSPAWFSPGTSRRARICLPQSGEERREGGVLPLCQGPGGRNVSCRCAGAANILPDSGKPICSSKKEHANGDPGEVYSWGFRDECLSHRRWECGDRWRLMAAVGRSRSLRVGARVVLGRWREQSVPSGATGGAGLRHGDCGFSGAGSGGGRFWVICVGDPMEKERRMTVSVDKELCVGCGICVSLCPELFEMGADELAFARSEFVPADYQDCCSRAAEECPVNAIKVLP
jgi:ferredoxin